MGKNVYKIEFSNYMGQTFIELYYKGINAKKRFRDLCKEGKKYEEFEQDGNACTYFNADYNEYSTFITLEEVPLSALFYDVEDE